MMDARSRADQLREASNPLFNNRKLKLGTFCSNLSGGCTMSSIDGILQARWDDTLTLARMADEMEFEAIVPVGRWKGFGVAFALAVQVLSGMTDEERYRALRRARSLLDQSNKEIFCGMFEESVSQMEGGR